MRNIHVLAAAAVFVFGLSGTAAAAQAAPSVGISSISCNAEVKIVNDVEGRVWDIEGGSSVNNADIQMYDDHGESNQVWSRCFDTQLDGFVIKNANTNKCVDIEDAGVSNHAKVQLFTCHWGSNQRFVLVNNDGGYSIRNVHSGKCVDIPGPNWGNGVDLQQYTCTGNLNQRFRLVVV